MIANLRTLPPEMPIYTAYHIPMDGEPSLLRVKRPTMSRERVDGITIKTGDESVPYSAVIWTQPQDPLEAHPSPTPAADDDRVRIADADAKWLTRWLGDQKEGGHCGEGNVERRERAIWNDRIDRVLAALKSEGK